MEIEETEFVLQSSIGNQEVQARVLEGVHDMEVFHLTILVVLLIHGYPNVSAQGHHEVTVDSAERLRRNTDNASLNVFFTILHVSGVCPGGSTAGLGDTTLRLEFRSNASNFQWVEAASGIPTDVGLYSITVSAGCGVCVGFRLVQEEHGGGDCNCWNISGNVLVNGSAVNVTQGRTVPIQGVQGGRLV